jgi:hypothetical protein
MKSSIRKEGQMLLPAWISAAVFPRAKGHATMDASGLHLGQKLEWSFCLKGVRLCSEIYPFQRSRKFEKCASMSERCPASTWSQGQTTGWGLERALYGNFI